MLYIFRLLSPTRGYDSGRNYKPEQVCFVCHINWIVLGQKDRIANADASHHRRLHLAHIHVSLKSERAHQRTSISSKDRHES
jgi:hypothetical protein